ncbi:MAG: HAMP domain-containing histidine kinase [candidate division WOR-3 bacterium]|nr:MAG: HAMP domain-containing histidine kinase [candidate division WOR-3 bacterium]
MRFGRLHPRDIGVISVIFIILILFVALFNLYISFQFRNEFIDYGRNNVLSIMSVCRGYMNGGYDQRELSSLLRGVSQSFGLARMTVSDTLGNRIYDSWRYIAAIAPFEETDHMESFTRMPEAGELVQEGNEFMYLSTEPPAYFYVSLSPAYTVVFGNIFRWHIFYITISLLFASFLGLFLLRNLFLPMRYVTNLAQSFGIEMKKEDFVSATFSEVYKKLKLREQMLVEFSAYIAHEFRNSLGAVIGLARLVEKGKRPAAEIIKECRNMEELIARILEYSSPLKLDLGDVSLNTVLNDALSRVTLPKRIRVAKKTMAGIPNIRGDHELLAVALCNLLKNAKEAIKGKGQITIVTGVKDGVCFLSVEDTGVGMDSSELAMVFNPFFSRKAEGMGLGLAYVRKVVEEHGGHVEARGKKGRGATFLLEFPSRRR